MLYNLLTKILLTLPEWECDGKEKTFSNTVAANLYFIKKMRFRSFTRKDFESLK